ncbi:hypothetical protein EJ08DRAFT_718723 [Tothia fuscella]|uniref:Uncharacterized protein n=1 Tax=Tothia fuscella TaxID=1048955 RepID=A0A9P4TWC4_9PEZI|nr:hypothetical protein EJ08DRAFT_718723 [Tothia fuscella]
MRAAIGTFAVFLSSLIHAIPHAQNSTKFAIQVTASLDGGAPTTLYLSKDKVGGAVSDIKDAAPCTITSRNYLSCDGRTMGASPTRDPTNPQGGFGEVIPITAVGTPSTMIDNYSVDGGNVLHWKSEKFADLPAGKTIMKPKGEGGQDGEAVFGLATTSDGAVQVVTLIGYTNGEVKGFTKVAAGTAKAVPL